MADNEKDPFASIIDHSRHSSSQEDLLKHSKFVREDESFSEADVAGKQLEAGYSGDSHQVAGVEDESAARYGGGYVGVGAGCTARRNLGFEGKRKEWAEFEGEGGEVGEASEKQSSDERKVKKVRVLRGEGGSPLVHCSGRMVIEREEDGNEVVVFSGDVKVEIVSPLRCFVPDSVECTEKLYSEGGGDEKMDVARVDNEVKKELQFEGDTEVIEVEEDKGNGLIINGEIGHVGREDENQGVDMRVDHREGRGGHKDDERKGDEVSTSEKGMKRRGKRELPRSLFKQWGEGLGKEGGFEEASVAESKEDCFKEASVEGSEKSGLKVVSVEQHREGCLTEASPREKKKSGSKEVSVEGSEKGCLREVSVERHSEGCLKEASPMERKESGSKEASVEGSKEGVSKEASTEGSKEGVSKEASTEGNRDEKSKGGEAALMRSISDILRVIMGERPCNDDEDGEIDILETAKRHGMTFPRSRFLAELEEDE